MDRKKHIRQLEKELRDLQADHDKARERGAALQGELDDLDNLRGSASFEAFRGTAGAADKARELRERRAQLEAEYELVEDAVSEAGERIAGVQDQLAAALREANSDRIRELEGRISSLHEAAEASLKEAAEHLSEIRGAQYEIGQLQAKERSLSGGESEPQVWMRLNDQHQRENDSLVRLHLGDYLLDPGGY